MFNGYEFFFFKINILKMLINSQFLVKIGQIANFAKFRI